MTFKDKIEIAFYAASLLAMAYGAVRLIIGGIDRWRRQRDNIVEDAFVSSLRSLAYEHGAPSLNYTPEPGTAEQLLCERLVAKHKLARGHFGYCLPESVP